MQNIPKTWFWLTLFSVAMAFLETSVVVYLRELYYPNGFQFPLAAIKPSIAITEFLREAATLVMLLGIGILSGRNASQRFAFAIFSFGVWDIFYYVFLKLLLGWPESLLTWDILFIIPVPWVGPVLAPCLVSLTMIGLAILMVYFDGRRYEVRFILSEKLVWCLGCLIIVGSFIWDYAAYVVRYSDPAYLWSASGQKDLFSEAPQYVPQDFNWWLFGLGQGLLLLGVAGWTWRILLTGTRRKATYLQTTNRTSNPVTVPPESFTDYLNGL